MGTGVAVLSEKRTPAGVGCDMLDGYVESLGTPERETLAYAWKGLAELKF